MVPAFAGPYTWHVQNSRRGHTHTGVRCDGPATPEIKRVGAVRHVLRKKSQAETLGAGADRLRTRATARQEAPAHEKARPPDSAAYGRTRSTSRRRDAANAAALISSMRAASSVRARTSCGS